MRLDDLRDAFARRPPVTRPLVKLLVPSAGLFALYLGGLVGVFLTTRSTTPPSWFTTMLAVAVVSTLCAFGAMTAVDTAIGRNADHVDILKTLYYLCAAAFAVMLERLVGERLGWALPQALENLAIWGAGVASIWEEEPGFAGWKATLEALRRARPPR
jgi:hypothetical protein